MLHELFVLVVGRVAVKHVLLELFVDLDVLVRLLDNVLWHLVAIADFTLTRTCLEVVLFGTGTTT